MAKRASVTKRIMLSECVEFVRLDNTYEPVYDCYGCREPKRTLVLLYTQDCKKPDEVYLCPDCIRKLAECAGLELKK